jgi:hypothetical protein
MNIADHASQYAFGSICRIDRFTSGVTLWFRRLYNYYYYYFAAYCGHGRSIDHTSTSLISWSDYKIIIHAPTINITPAQLASVLLDHYYIFMWRLSWQCLTVTHDLTVTVSDGSAIHWIIIYMPAIWHPTRIIMIKDQDIRQIGTWNPWSACTVIRIELDIQSWPSSSLTSKADRAACTSQFGGLIIR